MRNRVIFFAALAIAVVLLPRVYDTVEAVRDVFPIDEGVIVNLHLDFVPWYRAVFIAAHAFVAWFAVLIWRHNATSLHKVITLVLLAELIIIYAVTLRFWYGGIEVTLY